MNQKHVMSVLRAGVLACMALALPATAATLDIDEDLQQELLQSYENRGDDYKPRTEHFTDDGTPQYINRLIKEDSPYLLQHAHNPVNWYPWGSVMERESFESEEVAAQMNEQYIAIKVDREQLVRKKSLWRVKTSC